MSRDRRRRRPRGGHAPVGQVGPQLRRVRRRRRAAARSPTPASQWHDIEFVAGADTMRNGYPGYVAGATFAPGARLEGRPRRVVLRRLRVGRHGARASPAPRSSPASATSRSWSAPTPRPKGFFAPTGGDRPDDPDWLRFRLLGATNPTYFALYARRRMEMFGATAGRLRPGEGQERRARARQPERAVPQGVHRRRGRWRRRWSPIRCGCSRSARRATARAAIVLTSMDFARRGTPPSPVRVAAISTVTPTYPQHDHRDARTSRPTPRPWSRRPSGRSATRSRTRAYEEAGLGPDDLDLAEVYDLSTALELDWYENIGLCKPEGEAEKLLHDGDTTIGGRIPVNPSGGLALLRRGRAGPGHRPGVRGARGSCAARPATARSRAPTSASPSTRACSATARR